MALTKANIAEKLTDVIGLNKRESTDLVELFFKELIGSLSTGNIVKLSGFGNFSLRDKKSRPGRNPKTGELVMIAPRRVVNFHAGQKLKAKIERNTSDPAAGE